MEANNGILLHMETDPETNPSVSIFYPQVIGELTPFQGRQFETLEEVYDFYNQYAREAGFSVQSYSSKKSKDGEVIRKEYVCNKEGSWSTETSGVVKRHRGVGRESCKARLIVVKSKYGGYVVTIFEEAHTHRMTTPRRRHLLKSHRRIFGVNQLVAQQLIFVNVSTHQQYDILATQAGGIENVGFTQQDMYNSKRDRRMKIKGHDGEMLFDHFMNEQEKNPGFIFKVETNIEHKITQCFWADAISRQLYKFYGDAVIFDTTYNTNRYCMIFAPIMGVNNHGQTIIFSGAFLSDETADSFIWLFREFLRAMPGDALKIIITDQDPAMTKAISEALPNTFQRYCSWHILNKFSDKPECILHYQQFRECVWDSESRDEFDLRWKSIVENSGSNEDTWLQSIFNIQSKWVPTYVNHIFSCGMSSSQRAESGHAFFKSHTLAYLHKIRQLHELPDQYILKGWTRSARSDLVVDNDGVEISVDNSLIGKRSALFQRYSHVIDKVILSDKASQIFCEALDSLIERIKPLLNGAEEVLPSARRNIDFETSLNEPDPVKSKGSRKDLRAERSWREKNTKVGVVMGVENMDKHTTKGTVLCFKNRKNANLFMLLMAWIIVLRHRMMSFLEDVSSSSDSTYFLEGARTWLIRCLQQHKMCVFFFCQTRILFLPLQGSI
ncbi:unnamed protein product [Prunus brigantina]